MKKQTKIISLVVVLVLLLGAFAVFASAFEASATPSATYSAPINSSDEVGVSGVNNTATTINRLSVVNFKTSGETCKAYTVTPAGSTDSYGMIVVNADTINGDPWFGALCNTANTVLSSTGYFVFDIDLATEYETFSQTKIWPTFANPKSNGTQTIFGTSIPTDGKWHHFTFIGDVGNDKMHIFRDGKLISSSASTIPDGAAINHIRFMNLTGAYEKGSTISFDEASLRIFEANTDIAAAITAKSLAGWTDAITAPTKDRLPSIATIDGVSYSSVKDVERALSVGGNHEVTIDRALLNIDAVANSTATIKTVDGRANFITAGAGYVLTDNGDNTYTISKDTRVFDITVNVADSTYVFEDVVYGTDVLEMLEDEGVVIRGTAAVDKEHNIYTGITWDVTPVKVTGEATYTATGTKYTKGFLALDENGAIVEYDGYSAAWLMSWAIGNKNDTASRWIILNADMEVASEQKFVYGAKHIFLNGHTLTPLQPATVAHHTFCVMPGNAGDFSIIGPGKINNTVRGGKGVTGQFIYAGEGYNGNIELKNLDIETRTSFAYVRDGKFTVENCSFDAITTGAVHLFQFARLNTSTGAGSLYGVEATFKNSTIRARHYHGQNYFFVVCEATPAGITNFIRFDGCDIDFGYGAESGIACPQANVTVEFHNSSIHANNLFYTHNFAGTALVGENCKFSRFPTGANVANNKIIQVKNNDPTLPYEFSSNYATVTWSEGTVEYWADGSTPVNGNARYDGVCVVEGGKEYTFEKAVEAVPFQMYVNLTLTNNIQYNVYIKEDADVTSVQIGDVVYDFASHTEYSEGTLMGNCKMFSLDVAPYLANGEYTVVVTTPEYTVARTISLVEYATEVYKTYPAAEELMSNILKYALEAQAYFAVHSEDISAVEALLADHANTDIVPEAMESDMSALSAYISSATINIASAPTFRFKLVAGADISGLKVTVDGEEVAYTVGDGYIELALTAAQMTKDIVFTVGDATGNYNLYTYYNYVVTTADGATTDTTENVEKRVCYRAVELIKALYSYAAVAGK